MKRDKFRRWILQYFILLALFCFVVGFCNYYVDPLWSFDHSNYFNSKQLGFDERQQKSNYLASHTGDFDALLLGSSRVLLINQNHVSGYKAYNFSVSAMMPDEYSGYIQYARKHSRKKLKLIILGLDFFGSNKNFNGYGHRRPEYYFRNAESLFYRIQSLFTWDELTYSFRNIRQLYHPTNHSYYNRENVNIVMPISERFRDIRIKRNLQDIDLYLYGKTYAFRDVKPYLRKIREENSDTKIIVFTTPESKALWSYLVQAGRIEDYLRWIGDIVEVFGSVQNYMGENELTCNLANYQDAHHLIPEVGIKLLECVQKTDADKTGCKFGSIITRENYPEFAENIRRRYITSKN